MSELSFRGVWSRFQEIAERAGDRPALVEAGQDVTYAQLRQDAEALAFALVQRLGRGRHHIGVRTVSARGLVTAVMACARADMVSVCLDVRDSGPRAHSVCLDAHVKLVVTDTDSLPEGTELSDEVETLALHGPLPEGRLDWAPSAGPDDMSAITYSSGSTGLPKGIMWTERTRTGLIDRTDEQLPEAARATMPFAGSAGNSDTLALSCLRGGTMLPYPIGELGLNQLPSWLRDNRVEVFATVPTMVRHLLASLGEDEPLTVRTVLLYGEGPAWSDIVRLRPHLPAGAVVHNLYGAMEAAGGTHIAIDAGTPTGEGRAPAGWPVRGRRVLVVGPDKAPLAAGEVGQVVIEGDDLAPGYWGKPELSKEKWEDLGGGQSRYWTGDLGRFDSTGCLEVIGRNDHMVKVNGFKVELDSIEKALLAVPGVNEAAAVAREGPDGNLRVVAWARAMGGNNERSLRDELRRRLPGTMVPDRVVLVDELPRLSNGKVDRQELTRREMPGPVAAPGGDELTTKIAKLFDRVLDRRGTAGEDDFFDLGGDSLRAARLVIEVEKLTGAFVGPATVLDCRTPAALAAVVAPRVGRAGNARAGAEPPSRAFPVRSSGKYPPLVVVHDGTAGVMYAGGLARLMGDEFPVYGVEGQQVNGQPAVDRTVEQMAARYISYISRMLPEGPLAIFGYSFGGTVAWEMAQQLSARGREVPLVGLGDTPAPAPPGTEEPAFSRTFPYMVRKVKSLGVTGTAAHSVKKGRKYVEERLYQRPFHKAERYFVSGDPVPADLRSQFAMLDNGKVGDGYVTKPYGGDVVLFTATGIQFAQPARWRYYVQGRLEVAEVPAPHHDLMKTGGIEHIARVLADQLRQARTGVAAG